MTTATASRGSIPLILKPIFDDDARDLLQNEYNFYKYLKEADGEKIKLNGDYFEFEIQTTRNDRSANIAELGDLPQGTVPGYAKGSVKATRVFAPLAIGHEIAMLADSQEATYVNKLEGLWTDCKNALMLNLNRQSLGDGTGIVATLTDNLAAGGATATVTVDDTIHLQEGALFDIWDGPAATDVTMRNTAPVRFEVDSITSSTQAVLKMSDGSNIPAGVVSTDVMIRAESAYVDTTRKTYEMHGLAEITADADFLGIAKTNRVWNAVRYNANSTPIGPRLMARAEIQKRRKSPTGGKLTQVWASPEQALEVVYGPSGTYDNIRYSKDEAAKASVKSQNKPSFNYDGRDVPVNTDLYIPVTKCWMFNEDAIFVGKLHDVKLEEFGVGTSLPVVGTAAGKYVAADQHWLAFRGNTGAFARNEFVEVYGLPTPAA